MAADRILFFGHSYDTPAQRDRAMCMAYLAGSHDSIDMVRQMLQTRSPSSLAADMLADWPDKYLRYDVASDIMASLAADDRWITR